MSFQKIRVPTLLLYGEADKRSPLSVGEELHAGIPGSKFLTLPGVAHLCIVEGADQFNREVRAFLRDNQDEATSLTPQPARPRS